MKSKIFGHSISHIFLVRGLLAAYALFISLISRCYLLIGETTKTSTHKDLLIQQIQKYESILNPFLVIRLRNLKQIPKEVLLGNSISFGFFHLVHCMVIGSALAYSIKYIVKFRYWDGLIRLITFFSFLVLTIYFLITSLLNLEFDLNMSTLILWMLPVVASFYVSWQNINIKSDQ